MNHSIGMSLRLIADELSLLTGSREKSMFFFSFLINTDCACLPSDSGEVCAIKFEFAEYSTAFLPMLCDTNSIF